MTFQPVGDVGDFPEGQGVEVRVGARSIVIYRVRGQFFALKNICPHEGVALHRAPPRGDVAVCIGHGWEFDLHSGRCVRGKKKHQHRVAVYPIKVEEGKVYIDVG
jgi:nitrite reductase/ring-hydroxylating ferredoxin subunit